MKLIRLLNKLGNALFIPILVAVVCSLIFRDALNSLKYAQSIRYFFLVLCIIALVGILVRNKNEKNN